jgi:hypothetical protein
VCFVSLAATLGLLSWIYAAFGGDLGLGPWRKEATIAAVASLLEAGAFWASISLTGHVIGRVGLIGVVVVVLTYMLTHLSDSVMEGTSEMDSWAAFAIAVTQLGMLTVAGYFLMIIANRTGF